jgi:ribose 5-phosphate isomerase B
MARKLISDENIKDFYKKGQKKVTIDSDMIITSAAIDRAKSLGLEIVQISKMGVPDSNDVSMARQKQNCNGIVIIGSDHGGYLLKEQLKPFIKDLGFLLKDVGTSTEEACDYPDYAFAVAKLVSSGEGDKGIMIDAVGVASAIVANKIWGIRAAACQSEFAAYSSREHNDANLLTLGGRIIGTELAKSIVKIWLTAEFSGGRHQKRVNKINDIDNNYRK